MDEPRQANMDRSSYSCNSGSAYAGEDLGSDDVMGLIGCTTSADQFDRATLFSSDLAHHLSDIIVSTRPASIEITKGPNQTFNLCGGVLVSWESRGADISFAIFVDGEVQGFVGNDDRHFIWQVEDYTEVWTTVQSVLREYQRW